MSYSKKPPKGLVAEQTLRSLIRGIAKVLRTNPELAVKDRLELLRQGARLEKSLAKAAPVNAAQKYRAMPAK